MKRKIIAAALIMLGTSAIQAQGSMDHGSMDHGSMDHGSMKMSGAQGGSAPSDARDPDAYAGGYTLTSGPYRYDENAPPMHTADKENFASLLVDRLERVDARNDSFTAWDAQARFGRDFDKVAVKTEGEYTKGVVEFARNELLWSHAIANFWDVQAGWRHDNGVSPDQDWLAVGIQGLAPYWFEVGATAYVSKGGQTALRLDGEYDLKITQRLIFQPRLEFNAYGQRDDARGVGSGPSDLSAGLRIRYEITRQFAPYVGFEGRRLFGVTADMARADGVPTMDTRVLAGVRLWF